METIPESYSCKVKKASDPLMEIKLADSLKSSPVYKSETRVIKLDNEFKHFVPQDGPGPMKA